MSQEERALLETRAERALRRGELSEAFDAFSQLERAFPADEALRQRVAQLKDSLQPAELLNPRANFRAEPEGPPQSKVDEAELLARRGDFAGAIRLYRQLLEERPDASLLEERLAELYRLAQVQAPRPSAPIAAARDPEALLGQLLGRIASRRRG